MSTQGHQALTTSLYGDEGVLNLDTPSFLGTKGMSYICGESPYGA